MRPWGRQLLGSFVTAIAQWLRCGAFTAAEEHFLRLVSHVLYRGKVCALVGAIAKGLCFALATGTPEVGFTRFHIDWIGCI